MKRNILSTTAWMLACALASSQPADACTGITLKSKDGTTIVARTIEWGGSNLNSQYVVVPRGYVQQSYTPDGETNGMRFTARHGYVGFAVEQKEFIAEGMNEAGLSAGLFYFPGAGEYPPYDPAEKERSIADLQLVSFVLGECGTVEEVKAKVGEVRITNVDPRASTIHWRFADASGRQLVLEVVKGIPRFYENKLGVLTNAPGFEWHLTNLANYVNLFPGNASVHPFGDVELAPVGGGSGFLGLPGDFTPPSRFVRAAFFQTTAPQCATALESVLQSFHILNNFDIPIGTEFPEGKAPADVPSATQWTAATDIAHRVLYYRTMHNSTVRSIDLRSIDFSKVEYRAKPLDAVKAQAMEAITIE